MNYRHVNNTASILAAREACRSTSVTQHAIPPDVGRAAMQRDCRNSSLVTYTSHCPAVLQNFLLQAYHLLMPYNYHSEHDPYSLAG